MRARLTIPIALVAVVVITLAVVVIGAELPQASFSPDRILKGTTPTITITLDKSIPISDPKEIKVRVGGGDPIHVQEPKEGKVSVQLPKLDIVGRADVVVIGKGDQPLAAGQLTYVEPAEPPLISFAELLALYLVLIFALPFVCTIYDIRKSYKERFTIFDKLQNNLTTDQVRAILVDMDQGPTGLVGLTRGIVAVTLILLLAVAVFHLVVFAPKVPDIAEKLLMLLAGTLTAITGFYFGTKATSEAVRQSASGEAKTEASKLSEVKIANTKVDRESIQPGDKFRITAKISGGEPPYNYTVSFKPEIMGALKKESKDGEIDEEITVPQNTKPGEIALAVNVQDTGGKSVKSDQPLKLTVQVSNLKILNPNIDRQTVKPGDAFRITATVSGGKPPYNYTISSKPDGIQTVKKHTDGNIAETITLPQAIPTGEYTLSIHANDQSQAASDLEISQKLEVE